MYVRTTYKLKIFWLLSLLVPAWYYQGALNDLFHGKMFKVIRSANNDKLLKIGFY